MTPRGRRIWLSVFAVIGIVLAIGAWWPPPGSDSDNQGGYVIVLLMGLILMFIYVPVIMQAIGSWAQAALGSERHDDS